MKWRIVLAIYSLSRSFLISALVSPIDKFRKNLFSYQDRNFNEIAGNIRNSLNSCRNYAGTLVIY